VLRNAAMSRLSLLVSRATASRVAAGVVVGSDATVGIEH